MFEQEGYDPSDEFFSQIDQVSAGGQRLPQLVQGQYIVEINKIVFLISRPPKRTPLYIAEFTILESTVEERPAGMQCSWSTPMNIDMGPINVKRFVGAAAGCGLVEEIDKTVTSHSCKYSASNDQPMKGVQVHIQVTMIKTKEGKDFPEHRFSPVQGYSWADLNPAPAETAA